MKKRNAAIGGFLLLAVGVIGVGFAALTEDLTIGGTMGSPLSQVDVDFTAASLDVKSEGDRKNEAIISPDGNGLTLNISTLDVKGESVKATITVTNNDDFETGWSATTGLSDLKFDDGSSPYYSVSTDFETNKKEIAPKESFTFTITISLETVPTKELTGTLSGKITATAVTQ